MKWDESRLTLTVQIRIKVFPFVIDDDKSWEVFHFNFPFGSRLLKRGHQKKEARKNEVAPQGAADIFWGLVSN